ncbi:MAG: TraB/GumN family protein [Gammaproteobacteria bacterium]|nr:TraB/GumN family protein [Gammaproteobacteria bacterium]
MVNLMALAGLVVLSLTVAFDCRADTSLWRVTDGDRTLLLGGTIHLLGGIIHLLGEGDYPLPAEFDRAFAEAVELMFETDLQALEAPAFGQELAARLSYPPEESLRADLSLPTMRALTAYCKQTGLPLAVLERYRPPLVVLTLLNAEFQRIGLVAAGVDAHFYKRARTQGKPTLQLEAPGEQLGFIVNMGRGQEDALIRATLRDISEMEAMIRRILPAWREGDHGRLAADLLEPMRQESPQLYQDLVVSRNQAWMPKIRAQLEDSGTELVLVGALHLLGPDGLLQGLVESGYGVEPY